MTAPTTDPVVPLDHRPDMTLMREHLLTCSCDAAGHVLMRWQPGDGVYRSADYVTPPYTPRGRR